MAWQDFASKMLDTVYADPAIAGLCYRDASGGLYYRSDVPGKSWRCATHLRTGYPLCDLSLVFFTVDFGTDGRHLLRVTPRTETTPVRGGYRGDVNEGDIPQVALNETRRILDMFGYSSVPREDVQPWKSRGEGEKTCVELVAIPNLGLFMQGKEPVGYHRKEACGAVIQEGTPTFPVHLVRGLDRDTEYCAVNPSNGSPFLYRIGTVRNEPRTPWAHVIRAFDETGSGFVHIGDNTLNLNEGRPIVCTDDYLRGMRAAGAEWKNYADGATEEQQRRNCQNILTRIGTHLLGFAQAGEAIGERSGRVIGDARYHAMELAQATLGPQFGRFSVPADKRPEADPGKEIRRLGLEI